MFSRALWQALGFTLCVVAQSTATADTGLSDPNIEPSFFDDSDESNGNKNYYLNFKHTPSTQARTAGTSFACGNDCISRSGESSCAKRRAEVAAAAATAYKPLFYDNDFSYLSNPLYTDWWPGDAFKDRCLGPGIEFDVGGQYRWRYQNEHNIRGLGLTGNDDDFTLDRTRLFANVRFDTRVRFYAEMLDAVSSHEQFSPRPIEENRFGPLNLFVDGEILESDGGTLSGRVGRQELLYGAQRAVSPLDWANTRRTFDGGKLMWSGRDWNVDGFWTRPVFPTAHSFDSSISTQQFYGIYSSYKGLESDTLETYWLAFENELNGFRADSIGGRYLGKLSDSWQFELWGNYQFGKDTNNTNHSAGAWTCGVGRTIDAPWKPTIWANFDWASGGNRLGAGDGYYQFYPLGHKYLGFMDLFGRSNIETPNVQLTMQPAEKVKLLVWYYYLFLESKADTPYTVVGTPFASGVTPQSTDLGHELDFLLTYSVNTRTSVLLGYSHFFAGKYYDTPGLPFSGDADFYYVQFQVDF